MKSSSPRFSPLTQTLTIAASAVALLSATAAHAAENRGQRYSAGVGGSDMTSMLVPGWYGQVAMLHYHATKLKGNDGKDVGAFSGNVPNSELTALGPAAAAFPAGVSYTGRLTHFRADAYALLPRITYVSHKQVLGANVGFTAMLPLVKRQTAISGASELAPSFTPTLTGALIGGGLSAPVAAATAGQAAIGLSGGIDDKLSATRGGTNSGIGDLEVSPVLHWEIGDHQAVTFAPTIVLPTGEYNKSKAVNPGFGKFYTFRPSVQYGFIGDGWDVGARAVLSFNTRNKDTKYRSGNMLNIDFQAMKFVSEDVRVGLQGYVVQQLTDDSSDLANVQAEIDAADGSKMRAYALGPAVAWLKNGGEMLVEGKVLKEFSARNRTEGTAFWLTVSKPLGN